MTNLSINLNKIALIRNARGSDMPNLLKVAFDCERFGADGITVHPRPDERHIKYSDCYDLKENIETELNIEGYPDDRFMKMIEEVRPDQVTLVPDKPEALTSTHGWDTITNAQFLSSIVAQLKSYGCRVSIFIDPIEQYIEGASAVGAHRIELYTGPYAHLFNDKKSSVLQSYKNAADFAHAIGLAVNAGHDLNLENLPLLKKEIPYLAEVSIGHALVCDAIYMGLEKTIQCYKMALE